MAEPRHKRLYKDSPKLDRGEDGKMAAIKPSKVEADKTQAGMDHVAMHAHGRREMKHRHMAEHMSMHSKHENEHHMHSGHKSEMHKRHHDELKAMHGRHEADHREMYSRHEKEGGKSMDQKPIKKIESAEAE